MLTRSEGLSSFSPQSLLSAHQHGECRVSALDQVGATVQASLQRCGNLPLRHTQPIEATLARLGHGRVDGANSDGGGASSLVPSDSGGGLKTEDTERSPRTGELGPFIPCHPNPAACLSGPAAQTPEPRSSC